MVNVFNSTLHIVSMQFYKCLHWIKDGVELVSGVLNGWIVMVRGGKTLWPITTHCSSRPIREHCAFQKAGPETWKLCWLLWKERLTTPIKLCLHTNHVALVWENKTTRTVTKRERQRMYFFIKLYWRFASPGSGWNDMKKMWEPIPAETGRGQ